MDYSVGELAERTGVSVRTLHHYDELGLLCPGTRTRAGHRRYGAGEVERLHRILVYRALGFELTAIAEILAQPVAPLEHLERQRTLLLEQRARMDDMLRGVEAMMKANRAGVHLTPEELREVFGSFDPGEHADETEARWGETDAYRESRRRTTQYGKAEWLAIRQEAEAINEAFADLLQRGAAPTAAAALAVAERHRQHITRWFYPCPPAMHRALGEMYTSDARFTRTYEDVAPGLAAFVSRAVIANAERHTSE